MKAFVVAMTIGFFLTGCGADSSDRIEEHDLRPVTVTLKDGRSFECVVFQSTNEGGIWCAPNETEE